MTGVESSSKSCGSDSPERIIDDETKKAMAFGRERSRAIDLYLKAVDTHKYRNRGVCKVDAKAIEAEMAQLDAEIPDAVGLAKLKALNRPGNSGDYFSWTGRDYVNKKGRKFSVEFLPVRSQGAGRTNGYRSSVTGPT